MSIRKTAVMDLKKTLRTATPWAAAVTLLVLTTLLTYVHEEKSWMSDLQAFQDILKLNVLLFGVTLPVMMILITYRAIGGERENDGIRLLLSLPNERTHIFVGKLLSRNVIAILVIIPSLISVVGISISKYGTPSVATVVGVAAATLGYALVFVAVSITLSGMNRSPERAVSSAFTVYFLAVILQLLPFARFADIVEYVHHDLLGMSENPDLYDFVHFLNPFTAYQKAANVFFENQLKFDVFGRRTQTQEAINLPTYLSDSVSAVIITIWIAIPLLVGYRRFKKTEFE